MVAAVATPLTAGSSSDATTSTTFTATFAVTAGEHFLLFAGYNDPSTRTMTLTDNSPGGSNTYTAVGTEVVVTNSQDKWNVFRCQALASATITVTVTYNVAVPYRGLQLVRLTGVSGFQGTTKNGAINGPGTGVGAIGSGNVNVTTQPALLIGFGLGSGNGAPDAHTAGTLPAGNFVDHGSFLSYDNTTSGTPKYLRIESKRITATGNIAATFTAATGNGADPYSAVVVAYTEDAAPPPASNPVIETSLSELRNGVSVTLALSNVQAAGKRVFLDGVEQTITAQGSNSVTFTVVRGNIKYGTGHTFTLFDSAATASPTPLAQLTGISLLPQLGWAFIDLVDPLATSGARITAVADLAGGDQLAYDTKSSLSGSPNIALVTVSSDGQFNADQTVLSFDVEAWSDGWGGTATQTIATMVSGVSTIQFSAAGSISAYASKVGSAALSFATSAILSGYQNIVGAASMAFGSAASLGAYASVSGSSTFQFSPTGTASSSNTLAGAAALVFGVSGNLTSYFNAQANAALVFGQSAALGMYAMLRGQSSLTFASTAALQVGNSLAGITTLSFNAQGSLSALSSVQASASLSFSVVGALSAMINLAGASSFSFGVTGSMSSNNVRDMVGASNLAFTAAAALSTYANMVGSASLSFTVDGRVQAYASLRGETSIIFGGSARPAADFPVGATIFGVPIPVYVFKIPRPSQF